MSRDLATLVQRLYVKSQNDPAAARSLIEATVAAVTGDPAPLRGLAETERLAVVDELDRMAALTIGG